MDQWIEPWVRRRFSLGFGPHSPASHVVSSKSFSPLCFVICELRLSGPDPCFLDHSVNSRRERPAGASVLLGKIWNGSER